MKKLLIYLFIFILSILSIFANTQEENATISIDLALKDIQKDSEEVYTNAPFVITLFIFNPSDVEIEPQEYELYRIFKGQKSILSTQNVVLPKQSAGIMHLLLMFEESDGIGKHLVTYGISLKEPHIDNDLSNNERTLSFKVESKENKDTTIPPSIEEPLVSWMCYDGKKGDSGQTECGEDLESFHNTWTKKAKLDCEDHCSETTGKCGLNSISRSEKCLFHEDSKKNEVANPASFRFTSWECTNGVKEKQGGKTSCKTIERWQTIASNFCKEHGCNEDKSKCEAINLAMNEECKSESSNNDEGNSNDGTDNNNFDEPNKKEEQDKEFSCKDGCFSNDKCYPLGFRDENTYCSDQGSFKGQQEADLKCNNNFECKSNLCINSQCVSSDVWQKLLNWFKRLFL